MISARTKAALCIYLSLHEPSFLKLLFERHNIEVGHYLQEAIINSPLVTKDIQNAVNSAFPDQVMRLLDNMVSSAGDMRCRISPRYRHDERWDDLFRCLQLDGYKIDSQRLIAFEPAITNGETLEDILTMELKKSAFKQAADIIRALDLSAEDFRKVPPDYNGCLSNARVALQTLTTSIALFRTKNYPATFDETKWGQVLAYLRTSNLITQKEEEAIAGIYSFISPGAHNPIGLSEEDMARLGRNLSISICYFLVRTNKKGVMSNGL
jgi:hypothetical protein